MSLVVSAALGLSSVACAVPADAADNPQALPQTLQLMVKTTAPSPGDAAQGTIRQVSESAKVPLAAVRYVAASGGDWHAVAVQCDTSARCDDVIARLTADKAHFAAVTVDERRKVQARSAQ